VLQSKISKLIYANYLLQTLVVKKFNIEVEKKLLPFKKIKLL